MPNMPSSAGGIDVLVGRVGVFGILCFVISLVALVSYVSKVRALQQTKARSWSKIKLASFVLGIVALDGGLVWPVPALTMKSFSAHTVQHVLIMGLAPLFLAEGAPMVLLLQTSSRKTKSRILGVLHSRAFRLTHFPPLIWIAYYGIMYAFFLTPAFATIMDPHAMYRMDLANTVFFLVGALFWWPVVNADPIPNWKLSPMARAGALLLGVPLNTFLGLTLTQLSSPIAPIYSMGTTRAGADFLWGSGELLSLLPLALVYFDWIREEKIHERRVDSHKGGSRGGSKDEISAGDRQFDLSSAWEESYRRRGGEIPSS